MSDLPPSTLQLNRSFSLYKNNAAHEVEMWLKFGGIKPTTEQIKEGFIILYSQIYQTDGVRDFWMFNYSFTEEQKCRWEDMENMTGLKPILAKYQQLHNERHEYLEKIIAEEESSQ